MYFEVNRGMEKFHQWRNWFKTWGSAFSKFLGTYISVNEEIISTATIIHILQLKLIWVCGKGFDKMADKNSKINDEMKRLKELKECSDETLSIF